MELNKDIQYIKGVGPAKAKLLNKLGIFTLQDLITYYPREYEDRSKITKISDFVDSENVTFRAIVVSKMSELRVRKGLTIYKLLVRDESESCVLIWYNQYYLKNQFKIGSTYTFYGKVNRKFGNKIEVLSPVFDAENATKNTGKIIPIYPLTYNLTQNGIRLIIENGLKLINNSLEETLPKKIIDKNKLFDINKAVEQIHFPKSLENYQKARTRLVFEELLTTQLALMMLKNNNEADKAGISFDKSVSVLDLISSLPFKLTSAQTKVLDEIISDMESPNTMNRLLQGDVGSRENNCIDSKRL